MRTQDARMFAFEKAYAVPTIPLGQKALGMMRSMEKSDELIEP